ncbi:MAG: NADH-quinone oxidoreductase subunit L [Acetobacteraceae bacterium]
MSWLLIAVPALPLASVPLTLAAGRRLAWRGGELTVGATALALAALVALSGARETVHAAWFESAGFRLSIGLQLDGLTWFVATMVAAISLLVGIYALGYMKEERNQPRFFAQLAFFIGAMLTLVLSSSLILLFAAWEAVGIASYLLIGFRQQEDAARRAAIKAFLMTRIGDFGLLLGWLLVLARLRTTDIGALLAAAADGRLPPGLASAAALLMFAAAIGKSAQLPLTAWLPDAMVAPTPVSALLHSATMVAAGVFLLLRLYPLFAAAPGALAAVAWVGGITGVFSAVIALAEMDLKRVLAWSTSSHLGGMMLALGLGGPLAAGLALTTHAIAKSALFTVAGAVDKHAGTRDLRRLRGLARTLPIQALVYLVGALSLSGIQLFSFASSDDDILGAALASGALPALVVLLLVFLSGLYISRAGAAIFLGPEPPGAREAGGRKALMVAGSVALGIATALGSLVVTQGPAVLPFERMAELRHAWRVVAILAGLAGLLLGTARAWRHHAAPFVSVVPAALERALTTATAIPVRAAGVIAASLDITETWLDGAARRVADAVWMLATGTDRLERHGFAGGGDRFARVLQSGGERLRSLETGKIYLYTLGLFIWTLGVVLAGVVALGF